MNLEYAKNPAWANAEHTMIDLIIKWGAINEELPFTASATDSEAHGRTIFNAAVAGQFGDVAEYVPPPVPEPASPTPPAVSPRQIRQALTRAGLRDAVEQAVLAGGQDLKDWWEYSTTFERQNEQVEVMADALGVSAQQLDDLWILAATL